MTRAKKQSLQGMVDVSGKAVTKRIARATATVFMDEQTFHHVRTDGSPKGDVFESARIAGIMAAKTTPVMIPFCHSLPLSKVTISFSFDAKTSAVFISSEVVCRGQTGVEMEALSAVTVAALTIYDMMKWAQKDMVISDVRLLYKSGGNSGTYSYGK